MSLPAAADEWKRRAIYGASEQDGAERRLTMPIVKEYEHLTGFSQDELRDLKAFALANQTDGQGNHNSRYTQNYVGIIETREGTVLVPKVDFANDTEETKQIFFTMLRAWRGFKSLAQLNESHINAVRHFNMLEVFVYLFLTNLG